MRIVSTLPLPAWLPGIVALFVAGCTSVPAPPPAPAEAEREAILPHAAAGPAPAAVAAAEIEEQGREPAEVTPPATTKPRVEPAVVTVVSTLATWLRLEPSAITVLEVSPAAWPDACLGLPAEGEICASVITPGFRVVLAAGDGRYEYRTDQAGARIRLAEAPPAETGEPLLTWRDARSFTMLIVGTERVAFGRRGLPLLCVPMPVPGRAQELLRFLARFAPCRADTPAGEIVLRGLGETPASPPQQRMLAEWARLVTREAELGSAEPLEDRALVWRDLDGGDGASLVIGRSGVALLHAAELDDTHVPGSLRLEAEDLQVLYRALDQWEGFTWRGPDRAGRTVEIVFAGEGIEEIPDEERALLLSWAEDLRKRIAPRASRP